MAWLAVDKDGAEYIYEELPYRRSDNWAPSNNDMIMLPEGSVKKLLGYILKWRDDPVEIR